MDPPLTRLSLRLTGDIQWAMPHVRCSICDVRSVMCDLLFVVFGARCLSLSLCLVLFAAIIPSKQEIVLYWFPFYDELSLVYEGRVKGVFVRSMLTTVGFEAGRSYAMSGAPRAQPLASSIGLTRITSCGARFGSNGAVQKSDPLSTVLEFLDRFPSNS